MRCQAGQGKTIGPKIRFGDVQRNLTSGASRMLLFNQLTRLITSRMVLSDMPVVFIWIGLFGTGFLLLLLPFTMALLLGVCCDKHRFHCTTGMFYTGLSEGLG